MVTHQCTAYMSVVQEHKLSNQGDTPVAAGTEVAVHTEQT